MPKLIADHEDIKELVNDPDNPVLRGRSNDYFTEINALLKSSDIYVLMQSGGTIAESKHDLPD